MNTNITKKEYDPCYFYYGRGHRSIFNFNARRRHSGLFLGIPKIQLEPRNV